MTVLVELVRFEATRAASLGIYFWRHFTVEPRAAGKWVVQAHFAAPGVPYRLSSDGLDVFFAEPPASSELLATVRSLDEAIRVIAEHAA